MAICMPWTSLKRNRIEISGRDLNHEPIQDNRLETAIHGPWTLSRIRPSNCIPMGLRLGSVHPENYGTRIEREEYETTQERNLYRPVPGETGSSQLRKTLNLFWPTSTQTIRERVPGTTETG
jgi:hypothetical protein